MCVHCRGEKKAICGKAVLQSAVTCIAWPSSQSNFVMGLADGKVSWKHHTIIAVCSLNIDGRLHSIIYGLTLALC